MYRSLFALALLAAPPLHARVIVNARTVQESEALNLTRSVDIARERDDIRASIVDGVWDSRHVRLPVEGNGKVEISSRTFPSLSTEAQDSVVSTFFNAGRGWRTYNVWVNTRTNNLRGETVPMAIHRKWIESGKIAEWVPAQNLLSKYAERWAHRISEHAGPNCWHTSMASIFGGWTNHRYMAAGEFSCLVGHYFKQLGGPSQYGDLIRLRKPNGEEVHGFTYLGTAPNGAPIVFTKNGYRVSRYVFMDLATVLNQVYPGNVATYWRRVRHANDPSADPRSPCAGISAMNADRPLEAEPDPMIEAGLRAMGAL